MTQTLKSLTREAARIRSASKDEARKKHLAHALAAHVQTKEKLRLAEARIEQVERQMRDMSRINGELRTQIREMEAKLKSLGRGE